MAKTNITLQLDSDVIRRARVVAAMRGTSVSALVGQELRALVGREERYEQARQRATELLDAAEPLGSRTWTRDDIYADRVDRRGH